MQIQSILKENFLIISFLLYNNFLIIIYCPLNMETCSIPEGWWESLKDITPHCLWQGGNEEHI